MRSLRLSRLLKPGITRKLVLINLLLFPIVISLTVVSVLTVNVLSGLRAYVAGEGLYSKYQKDAVFNLRSYVETADEADYQRFVRDIRVPQGEGLARRELQKPSPDLEQGARFFLQGENAPEDVPSLINLFVRFRRVRFVDQRCDCGPTPTAASRSWLTSARRRTPRSSRAALFRRSTRNNSWRGSELSTASSSILKILSRASWEIDSH